MAHKIEKTLLLNGPKTAIMHFYLESDGISDEFDKEIVLEPTELNGDESKIFQYTVTQIWQSLSGFDATLGFDSGSPKYAWIMREASDSHVDFRSFGGIKDRTTGDFTGKLTLSTINLNHPDSKGTFVIEFRKN